MLYGSTGDGSGWCADDSAPVFDAARRRFVPAAVGVPDAMRSGQANVKLYTES